jgi:L-ascorbate metabolism protein UlaG (beta-lactamase superfamily)
VRKRKTTLFLFRRAKSHERTFCDPIRRLKMKTVPVLMPVLVSLALTLVFSATSAILYADSHLETDTIKTSQGDLLITFIGHGTLMMTFDGKVIHVDPFSRLADYATLPDADLVLITHQHGDHLDSKALDQIVTPSTVIVANPAAAESIDGAKVLKNGEEIETLGLPIQAVPAYNLVHKRDNGEAFHPKDRDNGYIVTFGGTRVYIAGDTENVPEMEKLGAIDVAFIPANLPYTMTPEMFADAAKKVKPKILYPYHYGDTDTGKLVELLAGEGEMEVRVRRMK